MEKLLDNAVLYIISGQNRGDVEYDLQNSLRTRLHNSLDAQLRLDLIVKNIKNHLTVKYDPLLVDFITKTISVYDVVGLIDRILEAQKVVEEYRMYEAAKKAGSNVGDFKSVFYSESGKIQSNSAQQQGVNHPNLNTGKIQSNSAQQRVLNHPNLNTGKTQNNYEILNKPHHPETAAFAEGVVRGLGLKPCRDRTIIAVIEDSGKFFIGTNGMMYDVGMCQRNEANHKINQGYHLCKNVCVQPEHAEVAAINKWKAEAVNKSPILHVFGAKRVCDDCRRYAKQNGIRRIAVYKDMAHLKTLLSKEY